MSTANADAEYRLSQKKAAFQRKLEALRELFLASDEDKSGLLSFEEFQAMSGDDRMVEVFSEMDVMCTDVEFFKSIDLDDEGSVSVDEFVKGVMRVQAQPTNLDVYVVDGMARRMEKMLKDEAAERHKMQHTLDGLVQTVAQLQATVNGGGYSAPTDTSLPAVGTAHQVKVDLRGQGPSPPTGFPADSGAVRRAAPDPFAGSAGYPHNGARTGFPICPVECIDKHEDGYVPNGVLVSPRVQLEHAPVFRN
jgi:Ca2+-binding EF-hand superfamily protein